MFSDGVFAVLITVLVLELRPPELPTFKALLLLWPTWLSYAVSYLFIAIVWINHHHLLRYATEATPRLMWFNFAHLFSVSLPSAFHRLDGRERIGAAACCLLCCGLLPGERNLYSFDFGDYRAAPCQRSLAEGAQDHALPVDCDLMSFRHRRGCGVEISISWARNVHLLPDCLSEARGARSERVKGRLRPRGNGNAANVGVLALASAQGRHRSRSMANAGSGLFGCV
jgi:hypothetical protein